MTRQTLHVVACALLLGELCAAPTNAQTQPAASGQATSTAQGGAAASPSGASATGSASGAGSARAGDNSAALASGSSVNAVLTAPVDSKKSKPGDPVSARTTQASQTEGGTQIPKGSTLVGHVSEVHARGSGQASSAVGIVFDKAVTREGHEIPLRNVGIQAVAAAEGAASGSLASDRGMMGAGPSAGAGGGGGLIGHATGAVGGTVGSGLGAVGGAGAMAGTAGAALQGGPGSIGGLNGAGMFNSNSSGVFGLDGVKLTRPAAGAAEGSLITSSDGNLRLDRGTRVLLSSQSAAQAGAKAQQAAPAASDGKSAKPSDRKGEQSDKADKRSSR